MPLNSPHCNHARRFNGYMSTINEIWASKVLKIPKNPDKGPDLISPGKFVEIKFALINPRQNNSSNYPKS